MTPEEAGELLDWIKSEPARVRRYVLEGGTRTVWRCRKCDTHTYAHHAEEAVTNIRDYCATFNQPPTCYGFTDPLRGDPRPLTHEIEDTRRPAPPTDFS